MDAIIFLKMGERNIGKRYINVLETQNVGSDGRYPMSFPLAIADLTRPELDKAGSWQPGSFLKNHFSKWSAMNVLSHTYFEFKYS